MDVTQVMDHQHYPTASLWRRLAALFYDSLIVMAIIFVGTLPLVPLIKDYYIDPNNLLYKVYLLAIVFAYFGLSWIYGQQTIGMRAWRLKIFNFDQQRISLWQALLRFSYAIPAYLSFGAGLWWMLVDKQRLGWHDRWSKTYLLCTKSPRS